MKKVLFLIESLNGGGAEKILCDIVKNLNKRKYCITVSTIQDEGIYIDEIKKYVSYKPMFKKLTPGKNILNKIYNVIRLRIRDIISRLPIKYVYRFYIRDKYDIEVAFLEGKAVKIISASSNKKSKKYTWVHTDLEKNHWTTEFFNDENEERECYKKFDNIICVSEGVKESFCKKFKISENVSVKYNPVDEKTIIKKL